MVDICGTSVIFLQTADISEYISALSRYASAEPPPVAHGGMVAVFPLVIGEAYHGGSASTGLFSLLDERNQQFLSNGRAPKTHTYTLTHD